ncbi:hypothetical protein OJAV_G00025800 [Oryzias javanicus]|uniref:arylamine N-acetyltransferase n=1 Tax=Oryzias javanicus TaxID=123683 RepID=A0A3S2N5W7_ORYJA|nr:hypothetical protein OJAV_G00025800 [Oryzias javanicus]
MTIPFENLSIHCGERISMNLELIFNKLVRSKRGGWCLESNYLFGWVLRAMGFNATTLGASVYSSILNAYFPGENHLINRVIVDGKAYITDVSFGVSSQVWEPLELISEKDQPQAAGVFCLTNNGDMWVLEKSSRKPVVMNPDFAKSTLVNRKEKYVLYRFTLTHQTNIWVIKMTASNKPVLTLHQQIHLLFANTHRVQSSGGMDLQ